MTVTLPAYSMFMATPVYSTASGYIFGLRQQLIFPDSTDQVYITPQAANNRLWLISELFYGVQELWWVIAEVNNIQDPLLSVPARTELRIPSRARLSNCGILNLV